MKKRMKNKYDDYNKSRRTWRKMMALLLVLISVMALIGCGGNKNEPLHGEYHTEANGHKRGIDLDVTMDGENIRAIILDDMDSEYTLTDPDAFQRMWPAKVTGIIQNLQNMGPDGINEIEVELDENGIPTAAGMDTGRLLGLRGHAHAGRAGRVGEAVGTVTGLMPRARQSVKITM